MTAKEAAASILAHVYGHVDAFRTRSPRLPPEQFAAAGLMRCCALLKGVLVLDEASLPVMASWPRPATLGNLGRFALRSLGWRRSSASHR